MSLNLLNLSLQGISCILFQDAVKSKEINRGALLVPYNGDKSVMIDRFDCRGYLSDLQSHGGPFNDIQLSHEEWEIEQSCNHERYYDLYHNDSDQYKIDSPESEDKNQRIDPSRYSAIDFDYDRNQTDTISQSLSPVEKEVEDNGNDAVYICPPNLKLLPGMITPATEREAAIIEQTAKFVADKGAQLEILIKAKQANNPKFLFMNYDHKLYPFYRHVTHLIKTVQYVPGKRHISHLVESNDNHTQANSLPLPIAPKIDISSTPYGKLIERFKQVQQQKIKSDQDKPDQTQPKPINEEDDNKITTNDPSEFSQIDDCQMNFDSASIKTFAESRSPSPASVELLEARHKMYEDLYQQYYPYYYQYYYDLYGSTESSDKLVEMARSYAASSAASWIQSNMPDPVNKNEENQDAVITKMAEYVARNGVEFEKMMLGRNSERFAFLLPGHINHFKYKMRLDRELEKQMALLRRRSPSFDELPDQCIASIVDSYGSSPPHPSSGPISFKMASKSRTAASGTNRYVDKISRIDELDDDFDFTDKLQLKTDLANSLNRTTKNGRISRFSPANPKNLMVLSSFKNDLQIQRKRKAAEFLASRMLKDKISKSDQITPGS